jgi:hypothetical protein
MNPEPEPEPEVEPERDGSDLSSGSGSDSDDGGLAAQFAAAHFSSWSSARPQPAEPAFARADDYDFDDWAQHAFGHMLTDFAFAMGDPDAILDPAYLSKLKAAWASLDPQRTGWLPLSQLPILCDVLVAEPRPILSWALEPDERETWSCAPADEMLSLREFALLAEWGEIYTRGEGDEDIARLQPGYTPPQAGVATIDAGNHGFKLSWVPTAYQVAGVVLETEAVDPPLAAAAPGSSAAGPEYEQYVDLCFSHLRNDCYSKADALRCVHAKE